MGVVLYHNMFKKGYPDNIRVKTLTISLNLSNIIFSLKWPILGDELV